MKNNDWNGASVSSFKTPVYIPSYSNCIASTIIIGMLKAKRILNIRFLFITKKAFLKSAKVILAFMFLDVIPYASVPYANASAPILLST